MDFSFHDPNMVIMPTPVGPSSVHEARQRINVRIAKRLARSSLLPRHATSKRLKTITTLCEQATDQQKECKELVSGVLAQLIGDVYPRSNCFRDEFDSFIKRLLEDNDGFHQELEKVFLFVENFQNEAIQQFSLSSVSRTLELNSLREQVCSLGSEVNKLKISINRLNAVITRLNKHGVLN